MIATFHHHILAFLALVDENWPDASAHLAAAADGMAQSGVRHPGRFKVAGDQVETALALGDVERATGCRRAAGRGRAGGADAVGRRRRARARRPSWPRRRADFEAAASAFDRALVEHDRLPMPFERGRTLLAKGRLHRRRNERRLADETLREALACFESLGAPDWVAKTRAELGRVGRRPHAPDTLTETERRVAELAATGLTSREIAERAFLAPKTVGNVLGRVYEKLGIHSRAELGALIASGALIADEVARSVD